MNYRDAMLRARKEYWLALLERTSWTVSSAAKIAEVSRPSAYRMIAEVGIAPRKREMHREQIAARRAPAVDMRALWGKR